MATNFLWGGAGAYLAGPTSWLTTELNSVAASSANVCSTLGAAFQNTASYIYADAEFVFGASVTITANAFLEVWLLRSIDGGTNYETGDATHAPPRAPDAVLPVFAGTGTFRCGFSGMILPPAFYKPLLRNQTNISLPSASNILRFSAYTEQY